MLEGLWDSSWGQTVGLGGPDCAQFLSFPLALPASARYQPASQTVTRSSWSPGMGLSCQVI